MIAGLFLLHQLYPSWYLCVSLSLLILWLGCSYAFPFSTCICSFCFVSDLMVGLFTLFPSPCCIFAFSVNIVVVEERVINTRSPVGYVSSRFTIRFCFCVLFVYMSLLLHCHFPFATTHSLFACSAGRDVQESVHSYTSLLVVDNLHPSFQDLVSYDVTGRRRGLFHRSLLRKHRNHAETLIGCFLMLHKRCMRMQRLTPWFGSVLMEGSCQHIFSDKSNCYDKHWLNLILFVFHHFHDDRENNSCVRASSLKR